MDPTRSIDPKKTLRPITQKAMTAAGGATTTPGVRPEGSSGDGVSLEVSDLGFARTEARRLDTQRLEALKQAIDADTYAVDADALARRILDDALGPEAFE